ncbi:MAG: high-potential iron-sulfur protein [Candidatus Kapaibacteriota bacterium]|jgi:hypothetical protein
MNRRNFLVKSLGAATFVGLAVVGGSVLTSCGGSDKAAADCNDLSALTAEEKALRTNFKYVTASTEAGKQCLNCQFYKAPATEAECGGCQLFKGPIVKEGYCISWAMKQS